MCIAQPATTYCWRRGVLCVQTARLPSARCCRRGVSVSVWLPLAPASRAIAKPGPPTAGADEECIDRSEPKSAGRVELPWRTLQCIPPRPEMPFLDGSEPPSAISDASGCTRRVVGDYEGPRVVKESRLVSQAGALGRRS